MMTSVDDCYRLNCIPINKPESGSSQHHAAGPTRGSRHDNEGDIMCRPTTCEVCGKITWKGCGKHIDSVKEQVPPDQWCDKNHTDEEYALAEKKSGFFGSFCS